MDFTLNAEKYKNQLLTQEEQKNITPDQMMDRLEEQQRFATGFEGYKVRFESQEDFAEGQQILVSDEALVQYYEKKDPSMLAGLRSKSSINVCGKKAEKKKLRRKYLDARSDVKVEEAEARKMWEADVKKLRDSGEWGLGARSYKNLEEAKEALKQQDTDEIIECFKILGKSEKELKKIRNRVSGLGYLRRQQLKKLANKSALDADLNGMDSELLKEKQTRYVKTKAETADWESYRMVRTIQEYRNNHQLPDDAQEKIDKYNKTHKPEIDNAYINRTLVGFMKEVKYTTENGKKVPATKQDEENLKWNNTFVDSLLSDNESDWEFRFKAMDDMIQECWQFSLPLLKKLRDGTFDYKKDMIDDVAIYYMHSRHQLLMSGWNAKDKRSSLFHSKYAESIDQDYREELDARYNCMTLMYRAMDYRYAEKGIDATNFELKDLGSDNSAIANGIIETAKTMFLPKCNLE